MRLFDKNGILRICRADFDTEICSIFMKNQTNCSTPVHANVPQSATLQVLSADHLSAIALRKHFYRCPYTIDSSTHTYSNPYLSYNRPTDSLPRRPVASIAALHDMHFVGYLRSPDEPPNLSQFWWFGSPFRSFCLYSCPRTTESGRFCVVPHDLPFPVLI